MLIGSYLTATCPPVLAEGVGAKSPCSSSLPHLAFLRLSYSFFFRLKVFFIASVSGINQDSATELLSLI